MLLANAHGQPSRSLNPFEREDEMREGGSFQIILPLFPLLFTKYAFHFQSGQLLLLIDLAAAYRVCDILPKFHQCYRNV